MTPRRELIVETPVVSAIVQQIVRDSRGSCLAVLSGMEHQHGPVTGATTRTAGAPASMPSPRRLAIDSIEIAVDDAIAASFPASDPPSWTGGTATVASASSAS
jgi:hypothetical protein